VKAVDTSIVVPAFASWHPGHAEALQLLDLHPRLPGHAALEAYSVLTRMRAPHRARPADVAKFLRAEFREPWLDIGGAELAALVGRLPALGISGGATYDAVIGMTAKVAGATLVTRDRRATSLYERLGVEFELVT
jgi:predicted nucleic acid-binding protein